MRGYHGITYIKRSCGEEEGMTARCNSRLRKKTTNINNNILLCRMSCHARKNRQTVALTAIQECTYTEMRSSDIPLTRKREAREHVLEVFSPLIV